MYNNTYKRYTINSWYGRLGNNIQQISNAIYFCSKNKINFYCPPHPLINEFSINFGNETGISSRFYLHEDFLDEKKDFESDIIDLNYNRREICLKYIVPNLKFDVGETLDENLLVIHLRGGDIFQNNPHRYYVQNPLSFYNNIIKNFKDVLVVLETYQNNFIVDELKKNKNIYFQSENIEKDFSTLLMAKNLATSGVSSFPIAATLCSKNIENLFCTNLYLTHNLNPTMLYNSKINISMINLKEYIRIGDWKNSEQQKKIMLEYGEIC